MSEALDRAARVLDKAERLLREIMRDFDRDDAAQQLEDACGLNPVAVGSGPIDRSPNPWWKNRAKAEFE